MASFRHELLVSVLQLKCVMLHHKCNYCLFFGKFNINHINVILLVSFQINLVYVRLFTETCKQTESSYKRFLIHPLIMIFITDSFLTFLVTIFKNVSSNFVAGQIFNCSVVLSWKMPPWVLSSAAREPVLRVLLY